MNWQQFLKADLVFPNGNGGGSKYIPKPSLIDRILSFIQIIAINFTINLFVLVIAYLILKQGKLIRSIKFLKYVFFTTVGGAFIDLIVFSVAFNFFTDIGSLTLFVLFLIPLSLYNFWFSQKFFHLPRKQAIFIGLVMGILTNPTVLLFIDKVI